MIDDALKPSPSDHDAGPWSLAVLLMAGLVVGVALHAAGFSPSAAVMNGPVLCPFRHLTGLECPGCGMFRSLALCAEGRLRESVAMHPFGLLLLLWAAVRVSGHSLWPRSERASTALAMVTLSILFARWLWRLAG